MLLLSISPSKSSPVRPVLYYLTLYFLFAFVAVRFEIGCDWYQYEFIFELFSKRSFIELLFGLEPGFYFVVKIINNLGLPYAWLNVISSAVFFLGLHAIARRQTLPIAVLVLAFPILIINMPMSAVRQAFSIGIMCFAFIAYADKKTLKFLGLTIFAFLFHTSAIVFILLWPLTTRRLSGKTFLATCFLAIPAARVILGLEGSVGAVGRHVENVDAATAFGAPYRIGMLFLTGAAFLLIRKKWSARFQGDYELVKLGSAMMIAFPFIYIISLITEFSFGLNFFTSVIADRFGYYMVPIQLIIISRLPLFYVQRNIDFRRIAPYAMLGVVLFIWTQVSFIHERCFSPYQYDINLTLYEVSSNNNGAS